MIAQDDAVAAQHWQAAGDLRRGAACAAAAARNSASLVDRARPLLLVAQCSDAAGRSPHWLQAAAALSEAGLHEEALAATESVDRSDLNTEQQATVSLIRTRGLWHRGDATAALACAAEGVAAAEAGTREEAVLTLGRIRCETMSTGVQDHHRGELTRVATIIGEGPGAAALLNVSGLVAYHGRGEGQQEWAADLAAAEALEDIDNLMRCGNNLIAWHESSGDQEAGLALDFQLSNRATALGLGNGRPSSTRWPPTCTTTAGATPRRSSLPNASRNGRWAASGVGIGRSAASGRAAGSRTDPPGGRVGSRCTGMWPPPLLSFIQADGSLAMARPPVAIWVADRLQPSAILTPVEADSVIRGEREGTEELVDQQLDVLPSSAAGTMDPTWS